MNYNLTKNFRFESAHRLAKGYKGKCANIHGHSWNGVLELEQGTNLDEFDMGTDYYQMGQFTKEVEAHFDHKIILCIEDTEIIDLCNRNEWKMVVLKKNPTCEAIAAEIFEMARQYFSALPVRVKSITIKETCTTSCTYGS